MPCAWPFLFTPKSVTNLVKYAEYWAFLAIYQHCEGTVATQAAQGSVKEETTMIYYRDNVPKRKKGSLAQDGIYIPKQNGASIARHIYTQRG